MSTPELVQEVEPFGGQYGHLGLGLGPELEQVQRACTYQIMKFLPEITEQMQNLWDIRDNEYSESVNTTLGRIQIPEVEKENFYTGQKPSLVLAPLDKFPNITSHCLDAKGSVFQADMYDTYDVDLCIEILCLNGPVASEEKLHEKEGIQIEEELNSKLHRLTGAVMMCIKKNPTLGILGGAIEKPPLIHFSLPWARQEKVNATGKYYILQASGLKYTAQKNSY